jgi:hypothetical protein
MIYHVMAWLAYFAVAFSSFGAMDPPVRTLSGRPRSSFVSLSPNPSPDPPDSMYVMARKRRSPTATVSVTCWRRAMLPVAPGMFHDAETQYLCNSKKGVGAVRPLMRHRKGGEGCCDQKLKNYDVERINDAKGC